MSRKWQPSNWGRHRDTNTNTTSSSGSPTPTPGTHSSSRDSYSTNASRSAFSFPIVAQSTGQQRHTSTFSLFPSSVSTRSGLSSFSANIAERDNTASRHPTLPTIFSGDSLPPTPNVAEHDSSSQQQPKALAPTQPLKVSRRPVQDTQISHTDVSSYSAHPYAAMAPPPQAVVASSVEEEEDCPVCLEPLSFSFRIPGEKPHIVPECGHALHEACFSAVYGPLASRNGSNAVRKTNLGVCGVCRRPMKVGDGDSSKNNKLAALTGMGEKKLANATHLYPGRVTPSLNGHNNASMDSLGQPRPGARTPVVHEMLGPNDDDPLEPTPRSSGSHHGSFTHQQQQQHAYVTTPGIQVRPEFNSIARNGQPTQPMTCVVIVELPSRKPPKVVSPSANSVGSGSGWPDSRGIRPRDYEGEPLTASSVSHKSHNHPWENGTDNGTGPISPASGSAFQSPSERPRSPASSGMPLDDGSSVAEHQPNPAFQRIADDLRARIVDWKGHEMEQLGPLQMFDILRVRRDHQVREFYVYLFKEAIICVIEERKKSLGSLLGGNNGSNRNAGPGPEANGKGALRLKGRIYIRHIRRLSDTSVQGELSLTVHMDDESFILIYADRPSLESWRVNILMLVNELKKKDGGADSAGTEQSPDQEEYYPAAPTNLTGKAARMLGGGPGLGPIHPALRDGHGGMVSSSSGGGAGSVSDSATGVSVADDSLLHSSQRSTMSSAVSSPGGRTPHGHNGPRLAKVSSASSLHHAPSFHSLTSPMSTGNIVPTGQPSNLLPPLPHPPMDLIVIVSAPPPNTYIATAGSASLKLGVVRTTLEFILGNMGPRDRLSLVSFEVGTGGKVRKTPFLAPGRIGSRRRLEAFINNVGVEEEDEFLVPPSKEEKTDVVTAVNHGLDVVLQRKAKNFITGMVLVSDAADTMRRAQMDLVLARAEAANVPIHSFGWGKSHDPASLWLMSNHTGGTYTFVRDWYDLRDCIAGLLGGFMSVGLLSMKLHLKVVDSNRFRIRKVSGGPHSIVSSSGRDVDIEIGELRYGERKEMLIELELDNQFDPMVRNNRGLSVLNEEDELKPRSMNATDQFVQRLGLDTLSISDSSNLVDGMMERMIDEAPVFEVDGSFFDPVAAKHVSRLVHPILLTVTLLPFTGQPVPPSGASDPYIVRRRMELLASEMMTRALVLVSRKNFEQAGRILVETKRILNTVLQNVTQTLPPPTAFSTAGRSRRELLTLATVRALQSVQQDIQILMDALEDNKEAFSFDQRNFGAQQAMILRDQKSWTGRTATEKLFCTSELAPDLMQRSSDWVPRE